MHAKKYSTNSPHSVEQLFALVADVQSYPEFIPWVADARIHEQHEERMVAELLIGFKGFHESYTSEVLLSPPNDAGVAEIHVKMIKGPFKRLHNHWRFSPTNNGSKIDFELEFEFKAKMLDTLMHGIFEKANERMINAFEQRAYELYGG